MRLLAADLRALRRPLTGFVALGFVALVVALALVTAWSTDEHAAALTTRGADDLEGLVEPAAELDALTRSAARDLATAASLRDPVTAGSFAAGHAASLPGALAVALLAAAHVGGGLRNRTLGLVLLQQGGRHRVLATRALAVWLVAVGLLAVAWAALALLAVGFRLADGDTDALAQAGPPVTATATAVRVGLACAVLAVFTVAGVLVGVVVGNAPAAFTVLVTGLAVVLSVAEVVPRLGAANPATWVATVMDFRQPTLVPDHLWVGLGAGTGGPAPGTALAALGAATVLAAAMAMAWFQRADIRV